MKGEKVSSFHPAVCPPAAIWVNQIILVDSKFLFNFINPRVS